MRKVLASAVAASVLLLATALPASAAGESPTEIHFEETELGPLPFGETWVLPIQVEATGEFAPYIGQSDGTVDVFIDGIAGAYATALPVLGGGEAYFAQPAGQPLLPAGEHTVRAVFRPSGGSVFASSQTTQTAVIRVEPLALTTEFTTRSAGSDALPVVRLTVRGPDGTDLGSRAIGMWRVDVVAGSTGELVESLSVPAARLGITAEASLSAEPEPGETYALSASFLPDDGIASSAQVADPEPLYHDVPGLGLDEQLHVPTVVPWWAVWTGGAVGALLLAGLVALVILLARRRPAPVPAA